MTNYEIISNFSQSMWIVALVTTPLFITISLPISIIYIIKYNNLKSKIIISIFIIQYFLMIEYYMGISTGIMLVDRNKFNAMSGFTIFYIRDFSTYYFYVFCPGLYFFIFPNLMSDKSKIVLSFLNLSWGLSFRTIFYYW